MNLCKQLTIALLCSSMSYSLCIAMEKDSLFKEERKTTSVAVENYNSALEHEADMSVQNGIEQVHQKNSRDYHPGKWQVVPKDQLMHEREFRQDNLQRRSKSCLILKYISC